MASYSRDEILLGKEGSEEVFVGVTLKEFLKEMEEDLKEEIDEVSVDDNYWDRYTMVTIKADHEYSVMESNDEAYNLAIEQVMQDLEDQPELFNQDWLNCLKNHRLEGQSFIEYASENAVDVDGWSHFLSHYDGNYSETKSGWVYWRES